MDSVIIAVAFLLIAQKSHGGTGKHLQVQVGEYEEAKASLWSGFCIFSTTVVFKRRVLQPPAAKSHRHVRNANSGPPSKMTKPETLG